MLPVASARSGPTWSRVSAAGRARMRLLVAGLATLALAASPDARALDGGSAPLVPADTTALWVADGASSADTVIVYCQGGPTDSLGIVRDGRTSLRYLPGYERYAIAYVHQAQTLDPSLYVPRDDLSRADARALVDATSEMLHRTIRYHVDRGRTVFAIGTSYGAYVILHHLARQGPEAAGYVLLAPRVDTDSSMEAETWDGVAGSYAEDGRMYVPADRSELEGATRERRWERLLENRLKAAIGLRYSDLLAEVDLSRVRVFYATNDQAVGALTEAEVGFLESRGATVTATQDGHREVLYRFIDAVMEGRVRL